MYMYNAAGNFDNNWIFEEVILNSYCEGGSFGWSREEIIKSIIIIINYVIINVFLV